MIRRIVAPGAPEAAGAYCHATTAGDLVFCSGQIGLDPAGGGLVRGGVEEQARQCLRNLEAVLAGAGSGLDLLLRVTVYLVDMADFGLVDAAYRAALATPPARVTVGVAALPLGAAVEMECTALLRPTGP